MRVQTVHSTYRRMLARDGHHIDGRIMNGRKSFKSKVDENLKTFLLSHSVLQKWSGLTISQRVKLIELEHNVVLGCTTLKDFYKKHKVKYLQVSYMYYQAFKKGPMAQYNFAVKIAQLIEQKQVLIYFDEASFNLWLKRTHTWSTQGRPVRIVLGQNRCKGITVFGAISSSLNRAVFAQEESTSGEAFTRFLNQLRTRFLIGYPKLYVVIDNAPAHRTLVNRQRAIDLKIELLFMPPYSPELNSIESLWSVIKRDFKQRALENVMFKMNQTQFSELLQKSLDAITPMQQSRAARLNNREYVERCLGDLILSRQQQ